jgi:type II secretory pathway component PulK
LLLLVLLVVGVLFVIMEQFSYTVHLDAALAENHLIDAQAWCDVRSAVEAFRAAVSQGKTETTLTLELKSGVASVRWEAESGKFNLNALRAEDAGIALDQFERLFKILEEDGTLPVLALAGKIADFVRRSDRPILALGELKRVDGVTGSFLLGSDHDARRPLYISEVRDGAFQVLKSLPVD